MIIRVIYLGEKLNMGIFKRSKNSVFEIDIIDQFYVQVHIFVFHQ